MKAQSDVDRGQCEFVHPIVVIVSEQSPIVVTCRQICMACQRTVSERRGHSPTQSLSALGSSVIDTLVHHFQDFGYTWHVSADVLVSNKNLVVCGRHQPLHRLVPFCQGLQRFDAR